MKRAISPYFILTVVLAAIILTIFLTTKTEERCDTVKTLVTSVSVRPAHDRRFIGFDLNKHNLTFGTLSPGSTSRRIVSSGYDRNATSYVWVEGNFSSWVAISPRKFETASNISQDVEFSVLVPLNAKEGNYEGKVIFCYKDK